MIQLDNATVYWGSNLDVLPTLPDNSVDSIVTDPPYELGFMGKSWDSSGIAYSVELWTDCMRVLKPGGHLLAFGGSRTWHRLAVAIEDAGFEMRDSIAWLYGSGFPKSMDVSKAIDKNNGKHQVDLTPFGDYVRECREAKGWSRKTLDDLMGTNTAVSWWEGRASGVQLPSKEVYSRLKEVIEMDDRFDSLIDWAEAEREVVGSKTTNLTVYQNIGGDNQSGEIEITAPATPEAIKWQGWGTALKPAFEPVVVARKPFKGTVASNVLEWGVGGLNIDGSRIGTEEIKTSGGRKVAITGDDRTGAALGMYGESAPLNSVHTGRWPANIILDPYTAELLDEQSGVSKSTIGYKQTVNDRSESIGSFTGTDNLVGHSDSGGASRFFYVAKASKRDRNEGLEELEGKQASYASDTRLHNNGDGSPRNKEETTKNFHPTVKPTSLMEYLIKLVTPEGGTVLDPFTGSGSTGKAALLNGFQFIGIELTEDYLPIIEGRLKWANEQRTQQHSQSDKEEKETLF